MATIDDIDEAIRKKAIKQMSKQNIYDLAKSSDNSIKPYESNNVPMENVKEALQNISPTPQTMSSNMFANPKNILDYLSGNKNAVGSTLPIAGNIASLLNPMAARGGEPFINAISKMAGRIGYGGATGAAMSENPKEDLGKSISISAAAETLPTALRSIGKVAEEILPKQFTQKMSSNIKNLGDKIYSNVKKYYDPVFNKHGEQHVPLENITKNYKSYSDLLSPNVKISYKELNENPTLDNAHILQRQLGQDIGSLSEGIDARAINSHKIQATRDLRKTVFDEMQSTIDKLDTKSGDLFKKGTKLYRDYYSLFKEGNVMKKIKEGNFTDIDAKQLQKALKSLRLEGRKKEHPLKSQLSELTNKINKSKAIGDIMSGGLGAAIGGTVGTSILPGIGTMGGSVLGGAAGPIASHFLGHPALSLAQNPVVVKFLKSLEHAYRTGTRQAAPAIGELIGK